jgi:hypothetical protein
MPRCLSEIKRNMEIVQDRHWLVVYVNCRFEFPILCGLYSLTLMRTCRLAARRLLQPSESDYGSVKFCCLSELVPVALNPGGAPGLLTQSAML